MKRLAWLLLIAIVSFSTAGYATPASPTNSLSTVISSPPAAGLPGPVAASIPGYSVVCENIHATLLCVSVSDARVLPGSWVTIYGMVKTRGVGEPGVIMRVMWSSRTTATCIGLTDETGLASCSTYVPASMTRGYRVNVKIMLDNHKLLTSFRTKDTDEDPESDD